MNRSNCTGQQDDIQNCPMSNCMQSVKRPFIIDIAQETLKNTTFRTALWTGTHLQMTLMCIPPCQETECECRADADQFICIVQGQGLIKMGKSCGKLETQCKVSEGCAILIPANTWSTLTNIGKCPLKLYALYAPPQYPRGAVHQIKTQSCF